MNLSRSTTTTPIARNSINRSPVHCVFLFVALLVSCVLLPHGANADVDECTHNLTTGGCDAMHLMTFDINFNYTGPAMNFDTAYGSHALYSNNGGANYNSAFGAYALYLTGNKSYNTAAGAFALYNNGHIGFGGNTEAQNNSALGAYSLYSNLAGTGNTAAGFKALYSNTSNLSTFVSGNYNTAAGVQTLYTNTTGSNNTADGYQALFSNTTASNNTADGFDALYKNTTGTQNTATGNSALKNNVVGSSSTAMGANALLNNTGSNNIGLGTNAGSSLTTGSGNVCIGYSVFGVAGESNTTRIKNVYSSVASGRIVYVNSDNKIGTLASTRRVKENIRPMDKASEAILALNPVSFRYKKEIDASRTPQFGLVAEDVADINPDLVTRDAEDKPETVRYDSINAMLLNEFLKEHRTVQELKSTAAKQEANAAKQETIIAQQQKQIEALTAGLQKVSAQIELNKPVPHTVANNQ